MEEKKGTVLCGANSYEKKYYLNPQFGKLPDPIKRELQVMCVEFTEDAGGILTLEFSPEGELDFKVCAAEGDYLFDDIASGMKISEYQNERRELLEELELFYKVVFLGFRI